MMAFGNCLVSFRMRRHPGRYRLLSLGVGYRPDRAYAVPFRMRTESSRPVQPRDGVYALGVRYVRESLGVLSLRMRVVSFCKRAPAFSVRFTAESYHTRAIGERILGDAVYQTCSLGLRYADGVVVVIKLVYFNDASVNEITAVHEHCPVLYPRDDCRPEIVLVLVHEADPLPDDGVVYREPGVRRNLSDIAPELYVGGLLLRKRKIDFLGGCVDGLIIPSLCAGAGVVSDGERIFAEG